LLNATITLKDKKYLHLRTCSNQSASIHSMSRSARLTYLWTNWSKLCLQANSLPKSSIKRYIWARVHV